MIPEIIIWVFYLLSLFGGLIIIGLVFLLIILVFARFIWSEEGSIKLVYNGLPIKPSLNGRRFRWGEWFQYRVHRSAGGLEIDGWSFSDVYGLLYLIERKAWSYYLPPDGLEGKTVIDVGGGCGETAKFFLEHGAEKVFVIESNPNCESYLKINSLNHPRLEYRICDFDFLKIYSMKFDYLKLDIEGYEMGILNWVSVLKDRDVVLESHCNYITDLFLERGFSLIGKEDVDKQIFGGVVQLCRWKKEK